jgi:hypothetical protein
LDSAGYSLFFIAIAIVYVISALSWFGVDCTQSLIDEAEQGASNLE